MDFLPQSFIEKMRELLGDELDSFLECYKERHRAGLRVNTLKLSPERFSGIAPVKTEPVPWIANGFYYDEAAEQPSKHPYYFAGMYYIQEPSAMTPASLLPVAPGNRVLDLCAAPGGKSTELGARLKGRGVLVSNDISNSRAKALLKNVELFGIRNAVVISEAPAKLADSFEGWFDRILVDAPCSGEGMFRKSHAIIKNWEQYGTEYYAKLQREILPQALRMLAPGGYLLYSTCTFSVKEDEETLKFILDNYPDMHVVPATAEDDARFAGFEKARPELVNGPEEIGNALRIYPHRVKGEGHFVALLRRNLTEGEELPATDLQTVFDGTDAADGAEETAFAVSGRSEGKPGYCNRRESYGKKISEEAAAFLEKIKFPILPERLEVREDRIYMLPEALPSLKGLRVMRSGLLLGEMKKGRFEPSQALACALHADEYDNVCRLSADSPDVIRYLKCEAVELPSEYSDGYVLVCVEDWPLGWGRIAGGRFKNKYLPGWRLM